jgi:glucosylceramidase
VKTGIAGVLMFLFLYSCASADDQGKTPEQKKDTIFMDGWITSPQNGVLFRYHKSVSFFTENLNSFPTIEVDTTKTYQTIDGFGDCLTGGSAMLLNKMALTEKTALLDELFSTDANGIGISYLRISIGASDLSERVFSYDDLPDGETDPEMLKFSLDAEKTDLIPILKEILAINPSIKILGSPWSAPLWMKTSNSSIGGSLKQEYFDAYAKYFVKYIQGMQAEGITIDAITVQNEPLYAGNNPSMFMSPEDQALFIRQNLGPAFASAGINTKIIIFDHNPSNADYPITVLNDAGAAKYIDGSAFHLYGGPITALSSVHNSFPEKNIYFTEQWVGAPGNLAADLKWHVENLIIGATRNWSRNVLEWNLASDPSYNPHTDGGCDQCLGTVTINGSSFKRNPAYYILAHSAKFVRPGSIRVDSGLSPNLPNVVFKTPDGKKVMIVVNTASTEKKFNLKFKGKTALLSLDPGAVGTFSW